MGKTWAVACLCFFLLCFFSVVVAVTEVDEIVRIDLSQTESVFAYTFDVKFVGTDVEDFKLAVGPSREAWVVWKDGQDLLQWSNEDKRLNFFQPPHLHEWDVVNEEWDVVLNIISKAVENLSFQRGIYGQKRMMHEDRKVTEKSYTLSSSKAYIFNIEKGLRPHGTFRAYKVYMNLGRCKEDFPTKRLYAIDWDFDHTTIKVEFKDIQ